MLQRRIGSDGVLEMRSGTITSMRYRKASGVVHIELDGDDGEKRIISSDAPVSPFTAGQQVRVLLRRMHGKAAAGWRVIAMAHSDASSWEIIRVSRLSTARPEQLLGAEHKPRATFAKDEL